MGRGYYHTRCPRCAELGKDRSSNNLAVYDDGHKWCFSCSYHEPPPVSSRLDALKENLSAIDKHMAEKNTDLDWPKDYTTNIPAYIKRWLSKYEISDYEITKYKIGYSFKMELLVFPIFDETGNLKFWQGRNMSVSRMVNGQGQKYVTYGEKTSQMALMGRACKDLVIVEDFVSAMKVGRLMKTLPLFGSAMPPEWLQKLSGSFDSVGIWLDPDKAKESIKMALRASQYLPAYSIISEKDPKDYSDEVISDFIDVASRDVVLPVPVPLQDVSYEKEEEIVTNNALRVLKIDGKYETYDQWAVRLDIKEKNVYNGDIYLNYFVDRIIEDRDAHFIPFPGEYFDRYQARTGFEDKRLWNQINRKLGRRFVKDKDDEYIWIERHSAGWLTDLRDANKVLDKVA